MRLQTTLEEVKKLAADGSFGMIPVSTEIFADAATPMEALRALKKVSGHVYLLESAEADKQWGRYSFLGFEPLLELTCTDGRVLMKRAERECAGNAAQEYGVAQGRSVEQKCGKGKTKERALREYEIDEAPGDVIRRLLTENRSPVMPYLPEFTGGLVGYFAYDYIKYSEQSLKLDAEDEEGFKDVDLMLFDKVIVFDHYRQKIILIVNISTGNVEQGYFEAKLELERMAALITEGEREKEKPLKLKTPFKPLFGEAEYCRMVERAKEHIREGDIFQAVLSNRLEAELEGSLLSAYRVLRTTNPSPYMFYFSGSEGEIAGASPETLVKLEKGTLYTYPLAGTRPRGGTPQEDQALEAELLADGKELAEHNMLVDLGRNDIGKISEFGSVKVEKYMSVERYSHVMHLGSTVSGRLRKGNDALDAVEAVLPAGTLSGAPKLRACQIINELEDNKRGIYGGAIGYLSLTGSLDTCIAIRLAFSKNGKVFIRSGAGIVADSVPQKEYRECIQKAEAVRSALLQAQEGMHI